MSIKKLLVIAGALALAGCQGPAAPSCVNEQVEEDTWICGSRPETPSAVVIEESV